MEILILVLLYYLSQNAEFADSVKPLMSKIKDSEEMLRFLNDLSKFAKGFSADGGEHTDEPPNAARQGHTGRTDGKTDGKKERPQSPTEGIADEFIQNILDGYFKKR